MTDDDRNTFADALTALGVALGGQVNDTVRAVYWQFLNDLGLSAFLRAVELAGKTLRFFPRPAELRDLAGAGVELKAAAAWEAVLGAMRKHDYTTSVDFGPLVNAVVRNMGGWLWLCDQSERDLTFDRKKFEKLYAAYTAKEHASLRGEPLAGRFGGAPVRIAIGGELPPKALPARQGEVAPLVRQLAREKSKTNTGG